MSTKCSLVPSGEDCLLFVKDHTPDLILLDVSMPPGIQEITYDKLQETLRALSYAANKCIIQLTNKNFTCSSVIEIEDNNLIEVLSYKLFAMIIRRTP